MRRLHRTPRRLAGGDSALCRRAGGDSALCRQAGGDSALRRLAGTVIAVGALAAPVGAAPPVPLVDPTRPPMAMPQAMAVARGAQATALQRSATPAQPAVEVPAPLLQSVQLTQQGPASALIDGRLVRIGDDVGGATLVAIDASGVTLRGATGPERLWLLPGVMRRSEPTTLIRIAGERAPAEPEAAADSTQASAPRRLPLRVPPVALAGRKP